MTKKLKWIISLSVILTFVILIITLSFTVFSLKTVELDFRTSLSNVTFSEEEIIEEGKFNRGQPVFFHNKKQYKKRIEKLSPYLKVINIETVFPSKFVVHLAERKEVYAIDSGDNFFYICDEELRVLKIEENYINTNSNAILLKFESELEEKFSEGDFIKVKRKPKIYEKLYQNNVKLSEQISLIKEISLTKVFDKNIKKELTVTNLSFYSGQTFRLVGEEYKLKEKVKLMLDVYAQLYDMTGKEYKIDENNTIILTKEFLDSATIEICNYYNFKEEFGNPNFKDLYFKFVINKED